MRGESELAEEEERIFRKINPEVGMVFLGTGG
jgi:hypothetical protein